MTFEVNNTTEKLIEELQEGIKSTIGKLQTGQEDIQSLLKKVKSACEDSAVADQVEEVQEGLEELTELITGLTGRLDALHSSTTGAVKAAAENRALLSAIAAYLSLPGYKRFFKGMEAPPHETAE